MGTYTTNYNLFLPSIGEQGWGELVNGNFSTLDLTIKGLDTRTTALESADAAFDARITALENTIPEEGVINGVLYGKLYVNAELTLSSGDFEYATCSQQSVSVSSTKGSTSVVTSSQITVGGYVANVDFPLKINPGVYIGNETCIVNDLPSPVTRTVTFTVSGPSSGPSYKGVAYKNGAVVATLAFESGASKSTTFTVSEGDVIYCTAQELYKSAACTSTLTVTSLDSYYLTVL